MKRKVIFPIVVLVVSSIACSTFTRNTPENTIVVESTPIVEATMPQVEVVEAPTAVPAPDLTTITSAEDLPPLTFDEILDARVESGEWTEGEGLLHILKTFTGELNIRDDELNSVYDIDGTGIIMRVQEFLSNPVNDPQVQTEMRRMLNNLIPPTEILQAISNPRSAVNGLKVASPIQAKNNQSILCEDIRTNGYEDIIMEDVICLEHIELNVNGSAIIYYPETFIGEPKLENIIQLTQQSMEKSINYYSNLDLFMPSSINFYFQSENEENLQIALKGFDENRDCTVSLFPEISRKYDSEDLFNQAIAALVFYCFEDENFKINPSNSDHWWYFGSAEYLSNLVFPEANREHTYNHFFDLRSTSESIQQLGKENFVFFQYLGNQNLDLIDILKNVSSGDNLSNYVSETKFNAFVVDYLSVGIPDSDGETTIKAIVPLEQLSSQFKATISNESNFFLSSPPFTATRYLVDYEKEKRFLQSEEGSISDGSGSYIAVEADLYQNKVAWNAPPEEIRSFCEKNKKYLYVSTTTSDNQFNPLFKITKVEEASCDPCLLGVWKVDNEAFTDAMMTFFEENGVDFTQSLPGAGEIYMNITGDYFLGFKEGGEMGTWRNKFTISVGVPNVTTFDTVIQSAGLGNYSADGKFLTISDLNDKVISSKVYMGDSELPDSESSDASDFYLFRPSYSPDVSDEEQTISSGKREYKCENDRLEIFHETEPNFVFTRADELIPTPIPTETNP